MRDLSQTIRGTRIAFASFSIIIGILILVFPDLLGIIVGIYLILVGLMSLIEKP